MISAEETPLAARRLHMLLIMDIREWRKLYSSGKRSTLIS